MRAWNRDHGKGRQAALRRAWRARARVARWAPVALLSGGCGLRFGDPSALWLLWLVPLVGLFDLYVYQTRRRLLRQFASPPMLRRLGGAGGLGRRLLKGTLVLLALLATLLALARPRWGFSWEEVEHRGVDVVVALDVSDSMLATDAGSGGLSRLERARREIADLLRHLDGDRIGLVAFAGSAYLECPLTLDYGAAQMFLQGMDTDLISDEGTDLGGAIRASLAAFEGSGSDSWAILLITDGEDLSGRAEAAAREAEEAGVKIFAIGIGSEEGSPIPDPAGGFRRTPSGEIVLSRLDEETLRRITRRTGGRYARSVAGDLDLESVYARGIKASLEDRQLESGRRRRWNERFQWVLAVALAALMIEALVPATRLERRHG